MIKKLSCSSRSGNVVPPTLLPRNTRNLNHFPIADSSDKAYSEWLVKNSWDPLLLGQPYSAVFTVGNSDIIFKGHFVNPATYSDLLIAGKATFRTPYCVLFSDNECKRFSMAQATKAVQLSRKIDLINAILAHTSIHDRLGLASLTAFPQVHTSYKETLLIVHPDKNNGVDVAGESQAFQKVKEAFKVLKDAHDAEADISRPTNRRSRAVASSASAAASAAALGPLAAPASAPQQRSHGPAQGAFYFYCICQQHFQSLYLCGGQ